MGILVRLLLSVCLLCFAPQVHGSYGGASRRSFGLQSPANFFIAADEHDVSEFTFGKLSSFREIGCISGCQGQEDGLVNGIGESYDGSP